MLSGQVPLEDQVLVLPSRRAIIFFKALMARRFEQAVFLPRLLTMDDMAREISGLSSLDQVTTTLELYDSYREVYAYAEPFETFESWTGAILRDFNTIDTYLIDAGKVYRDLRLLKEINDWSFASEELLGDQVEFNLFWQRLGELYIRFNKRLLDQGRSYSGGILRKASEVIKNGKTFPQLKRITIAGFNALSPAEVAILDQFHDESRLHVLWDDTPFYRENSVDPAGLFLRRWQDKPWSQEFGKERKENVELCIASHPHTISQVSWGGSLLAESSIPSSKVALVLADEKLLTPLLDRFPQELEHVNITIGVSFTETSVFKFIMGFFQLHIAAERKASSGEDWALHQDELRRWAEMASYFELISTDFSKQLEQKILNDRIIYFSQKQLSELMSSDEQERCGLLALGSQEVLATAIQLLGLAQTKDMLLRGVSERLAELLGETQIIVERYSFIQSLESLWKCIKGGLSRERISFVGEPLRGLQVMGLLETRALDFDEVILLGANEGALPKAQRFDSFLPFDLRKYYGLPTQREEDAVFAYYFYRLFHGAKRLHIGYTSERDELGGGEASRYLAQLSGGLPQKAGLEVELKKIGFSPAKNSVPKPWVEVEKSDEVVAAVIRWYTGKGVSFSRLSEYGKCPLDFYYRTVLGHGEQKEIEEELGSSDLGDIVHQVLEDAYKPMIGKGRISKDDVARIASHWPELLQAVIQEKGLESMTASGESALVKAVAEHMLKNFFKRESARVEQNEVQIQCMEEKWVLDREVRIGGEIRRVKFIAKIDRVELGSEREILIDFKTGKVKSNDVVLKELKEASIFAAKNSKVLQLLYYTWFYWRHSRGVIADAGIISLVGMEEDVQTLQLEGLTTVTEEQLFRFEALLFAQLDTIATEGVFAHDTEDGFYCNYCIEKAERSW